MLITTCSEAGRSEVIVELGFKPRFFWFLFFFSTLVRSKVLRWEILVQRSVVNRFPLGPSRKLRRFWFMLEADASDPVGLDDLGTEDKRGKRSFSKHLLPSTC